MIHIGWIVRWKNPDFPDWTQFSRDVGVNKGEAIKRFNSHCYFYYLKKHNGNQYRNLYQRGLAKIAPVYIGEK
jgi:hypothetical protein